MTCTLRIKHPGTETFIRTYDDIRTAKIAYTVVGTIPGGFRDLEEDGTSVWSDYQPMQTAHDSRVAGELSAYTSIATALAFASEDGRLDIDRMEIFKQFLRSSIRNASDCDCDCAYSNGLADAMGMVYRLVSARSDASPDVVRELRTDLETFKVNAREAMA